MGPLSFFHSIATKLSTIFFISGLYKTRQTLRPPVNPSEIYVARLKRLLGEIGHRFIAPPPHDDEFVDEFHHWLHNILGPVSGPSFRGKRDKLLALEDSSRAVIDRSYPYAATEIKLVMAKLTGIAISIDDSLDDDDVYDTISRFTHRLYLGESQPAGPLALFHECLKELSGLYEGDACLRGMGVTPWINFLDGCLLEKRMLTVNRKLRASHLDMGYDRLTRASLRGLSNDGYNGEGEEKSGSDSSSEGVMKGIGHSNGEVSPLESSAINFPLFLRHKTGIGEAYAACIFKANKDQQLALSRYIKVMPDLIFFIEIVNDVFSFHKEQMAGETLNVIHLQTQALHGTSAPGSGTGPSGEWTPNDTFSLLCDEIREAARRIDTLLRLEECERSARTGCSTSEIDEMDILIAKQWRGWRDGYICWHLESQRYKLDFMRPLSYCESSWA